MKLKRILKWIIATILLALVLSIFAGFIAYRMSSNGCDRKTALVNPMKALRFCEYGSPDVLKFEDVEKPVPNDDQILIKVRAASLNFIDPGVMRGPWPLRLMSGLRKPGKTGLGNDVAGQVEAVGKNVTLFKAGDAGKVTPVIDRTYRLSETAEAMRYFEEGHARGKVIITVEQDEQASLSR
jgi:NADPH:quinone reductase-like Zn-dependent oxidoreductase